MQVEQEEGEREQKVVTNEKNVTKTKTGQKS